MCSIIDFYNFTLEMFYSVCYKGVQIVHLMRKSCISKICVTRDSMINRRTTNLVIAEILKTNENFVNSTHTGKKNKFYTKKKCSIGKIIFLAPIFHA